MNKTWQRLLNQISPTTGSWFLLFADRQEQDLI
jgi:hypothetical protein